MNEFARNHGYAVRRLDEGGTVVWAIEHRGKETAHNHEPSQHASSHPIHRRADMTAPIVQAILTDAQTGTRPAQTMARILESQPECTVTARDIYNTRRSAEEKQMGDNTRVEYLLAKLHGDEYNVATKLDSSNRLTHLFFCLKAAVDVFASNFDVVALDCTYKTNVFRMTLLNFIGQTGMNTTIHVAQAFLRGETQKDYDWALLQFRYLLDARCIPRPQLFLADRELALLNSLESQFSYVPVLLCLWHIIRDVESHARKHLFPQERDLEASTRRCPKWRDSKELRTFCDKFVQLTQASSDAEFYRLRRELRQLNESEATYIDDVWLDVWKRRIVLCWTNGVMHFGASTTLRVEGYHATLKRWLGSSNGDLLTCIQRMDHWWRQSISEVS